MDAHCAQLAHRLEVIAGAADEIAHRMVALDGVAWVSPAAQRYREELALAAAQVRQCAQVAREASGAVVRHGVAVQSLRSVVLG